MTTPKSKTVTLVAKKIKRYAGKALRAGDAFEASAKDAKALAAAKLAVYVTRDEARAPMRQRETPVAEIPAPQPVAAEPETTSDELSALRADYEILAGKKALGFWKADKIRAELEKLRADRDRIGDAFESDGA